MIITDPHRIVYTREHCLTPELRLVGWSRNSSAQSNALRPHFHEDAYEIHLVLRGRIGVMVGNEVFDVRSGHLFVNLPNEPHAGIGDMIQQCEFVWVQFDRNFLLPDVQELIDDCVHRRTVRVDLALAQTVMHILREHQNPDRYSALICRGLIKQFLVEAARAAASEREVTYSPLVRSATTMMQANLSAPPTLQSLCKDLGVSIAHLTERFRSEVGETPAKWLLQERINRASDLLMKGISTRQIAKELGFSTAQNFATTFRREMGVSPSGYRDYVKEAIANPLESDVIYGID